MGIGWPSIFWRRIGNCFALFSPSTATKGSRLLAKDYPTKGLRRKKLFISERTARTYVSNILQKLHLPNRTQAALFALREGLTSPEVTKEVEE